MVDQDGTARQADDSDLALQTGVTCCTAAWVNESVVVTAVEFGIGVIFTGVRLASRLTLAALRIRPRLPCVLSRANAAARALSDRVMAHDTFTNADIERIIRGNAPRRNQHGVQSRCPRHERTRRTGIRSQRSHRLHDHDDRPNRRIQLRRSAAHWRKQAMAKKLPNCQNASASNRSSAERT